MNAKRLILTLRFCCAEMHFSSVGKLDLYKTSD